jgi:cell division protein YceG involved in septum cleavage
MDALFSKMLKAGSTTYFMDVKEAKNNKKYLTVTASQPAKEGDKKFAKRSVIVFSNVADEFVSALKEANTVINGEGEFTRKMKSGKITYFVDVKEAKNKSRYVSISESQPSKEDPTKLSRRSITVFNNAANDFVGAMEEAVGHLKQ